MESRSSTIGSAGIAVAADPTRARMLRMILDSPEERALVGRLAEALGLSQPTVSHHMGVLQREGLVIGERDGRRVWYAVHPDRRPEVAVIVGGADIPAEEADWERVVDDLASRYRGTFGRETVAACVADSRDLLSARGDRRLLASRTAAFTAARLDDRGRVARRVAAPVPTVLFVCVQNAGRSQLAAAILRHLAGDRVVVRTAGSAPAADVRPAIVAALDEVGVPVGGEFPKPLTDDAVRAADVVVTMGCGDACPVYPGRRYLDWDLEDPVGKPPATVRRIRDEIDGRVRGLLDELMTAVPRTAS